MSSHSLPQNPLVVAVAQMTSTENVEKNQTQIWDLLNSVSSQANVVCFPENSLFFRISGRLKGFDLKEPFFGELADWSRQHNCHILLGSIPHQTAQGIANATVWISMEGHIESVYQKIHLFDVEVDGQPPMRESDHFCHGKEPRVIRMNDWNVGLSICYDLRFSELYLHYAKQGVELILVPSAFLVPTGQAHWHTLLRARAIETQAYVVAAAQSGVHQSDSGPTRQTYGHSIVIDPWGEILAEIEDSGPGIIEVSLDPKKIKSVRDQIPMAHHRRL